MKASEMFGRAVEGDIFPMVAAWDHGTTKQKAALRRQLLEYPIHAREKLIVQARDHGTSSAKRLAESLEEMNQAERVSSDRRRSMKFPSKKTTPRRGLDYDAMRELELYVDNDGDLYRQTTQPIEKNLFLKMARGTYAPKQAPRAWEHLLEAGAKKYAKEFGGAWNEMFPKAERVVLSEQYARSFENAVKNGEMRHLEKGLPKKYQGER